MSKKQTVAIILVSFLVLFVPGLIFAGNLEPITGPGPTMKSLQEIYDKLEEMDARLNRLDGLLLENYRYELNLEWTQEWGLDKFGTMTDTVTGLMWMGWDERLHPEFDPETDEHYSPIAMDWQDALNFCNNLVYPIEDPEYPVQSYSDWRSPLVSIEDGQPRASELDTLGRAGGDPNGWWMRFDEHRRLGFYSIEWNEWPPVVPSTRRANFWSGSTDTNDASAAWYVSFEGGVVRSSNKTASHYVTCVRNID